MTINSWAGQNSNRPFIIHGKWAGNYHRTVKISGYHKGFETIHVSFITGSRTGKIRDQRRVQGRGYRKLFMTAALKLSENEKNVLSP